MENSLYSYIKEHGLLLSNEKVLLAISGGADSVCLAYLFYKLGIPFGIAHCNFKLRGNEADKDEQFVKNLAEKLNKRIHLKSFKTEKYSKQKKISIETAARKLRYQWFYEIQQEEGYNCIATAHHQDDNIETFFINLLRGTGIKGLTGIKPKNNNVIRPLLFATKNEILQYLQTNNIVYREDMSNKQLLYKRNEIRLNLIPILQQISPSFNKTMHRNIKALNEAYKIYEERIKEQEKKLVKKDNNITTVNIKKLSQLSYPTPYLYEILKHYDYSYLDAKSILKNIHKQAGAKYCSKTHLLIKDRSYLIISAINKNNRQYYIPENMQEMKHPLHLIFKNLTKEANFKINNSQHTAQIDFDKLKFPLTLRKWKQGDRFQPLGMTKFKKISDFFIDNKINNIQKENIWLLVSNSQIVWVVGMRIDNQFKITSQTRNILQINQENK